MPHRRFTPIEEQFTRMARIFHPLLFMLAGSTEDQLIRQIEFLNAENEMLRKRVPRKRIFREPDQRAKLLKLGKELGPAIRQLISIVSYSTFRRWVRKEEGTSGPTRKDRPRLATIVRELVVRSS
jgi:putative transposase